jgi:8-oxo-dGTP pyrophosphatase MutT (NUDIX family)
LSDVPESAERDIPSTQAFWGFEAAILTTFSEDGLRRRFAVSSGELATIREADVAAETLIHAAVLVPIVLRRTGLTVLLTRRTEHLRDHAGQISFPGGRREATDKSATETALREAAEEVGLVPDQIEVIGQLPEYRTGTGFLVTPVIGLVTPPLNLRLDDFEVAECFETPLDFILDPANHHRHQIEIHSEWHEYWALPWQGYYIWGATAGMLVSLYRALLDGVSQPSASAP